MADPNRIDFRDALMTLSLLNHAAHVIGANVDDLFGTAGSLAEPRMPELILGFLKRTEDQRDIRKSWGYTVIETKAGPGFARWGAKSYQPSFRLDKTALALAELFKRDKYQPSSLTLASEFPAIWLSSVDDTVLKCALTAIRGAITISADLCPQHAPDFQHQVLTIFLVETDEEPAAESLFTLSQEARPKDCAMLAVQDGRLFCLVIGRCFLAGKPSYETQASLQRFSPGIAAVLNRF